MKKTVFITPDETGQFTRMVFVLLNAPFYFSKLITKALGSMRDKVVLYCLDDILIPGRNWNDSRKKLIAVREALKKAGRTIMLSKCEFLKKKVRSRGLAFAERG